MEYKNDLQNTCKSIVNAWLILKASGKKGRAAINETVDDWLDAIAKALTNASQSQQSFR